MKQLKHIAYNKLAGKKPIVVFLSGFKSDMTGTKAIFMEGVCKELGLGFVRFDYFGHGKSDGSFVDGTIGQWRQDALSIIDEVTKGELILVGSSMGGWLALLAALARPERVKALIGIASAPDFTEKLIWEKVSQSQQKQILQEGKILIPDCYGGNPYPITKNLIEEARNHLLLGKKIDINCPIRLLHGMADEDVPYKYSQKIAEAVTSNDVEVTLVKDAGHRFSEPKNLELLKQTLLSIIS